MRTLDVLLLGTVLFGHTGKAMADYDEVVTYSDHRAHLRYATVLGKKMAYIDEGQGSPVVLVHGIPTSSWMFRKIIPGLVARGYRVIAPDLIGLGESERVRDKSLLTVSGEAKFMLDLLCNELGLTRWSQLVHDFGGPITWEMMEDRRCKIDRLIVLDTFGRAGRLADPRDLLRREKRPHVQV